MAEIADIKGEDSLRVYLNGLPTDRRQPVSVAIAARAALRVAPGWNLFFYDDRAEKDVPAYTLAFSRCTLTAAVAPVSPTTKVRKAADHAAAAAYLAQGEASNSNLYDSAALTAALTAAEPAAWAAADAAYAVANEAPSYSSATAVDAANAVSIADAATVTTFWESVRNDLRFLSPAQDYMGLYETPLWAGEQVEPADLRPKWADLRDTLLQDAADWSFWIGFYEAMLHGRAQNWEMLTEIALLPDEDWRKGPLHMNPLIAEVVEKHSRASARAIEDSLASQQLRAAIADFTYDQLAQLMRMVPFIDDIRDISDPSVARDRTNKLSELHDGLSDLAQDIRDADKNVPAHLLRNLDRYCGETAKSVDSVRPGRLWDLGTSLHADALDEDTIHALGGTLSGHFHRMVDKHLALMKDYFAATLARMQTVDQIEISEGIDAADALQRIKDVHAALFNGPQDGLPQLDPEDVAVLKEELAEIERRKAAMDATIDPTQKAARESEYWKHVKTASVTLIRFALRAAQVTWTGLKDANKVVGTLSKLWPEQTRAVIEKLVEMIRDLPWPF